MLLVQLQIETIMYRLFLCFSFFYVSNLLNAQEYISSITHYGLEDGLSHNQIKWMHKDRRGMIWIGMANGISRYDSQTFKHLTKANFFRTYTQAIFEDGQGDLWLRGSESKDHLFFFNTITEKISSFEEKFEGKVPFEMQDYERGICLANGTSVIGTTNGQLVFYDSSGQFDVKNVDPERRVQVFAYKQQEHFWVHTFSERNGKQEYSNSRLLLLDNKGDLKLDLKELPAISNILGVTPDNEILLKNAEGIFVIDAAGKIDKNRFEKLSKECADEHSRLTYDAENNRIWQASGEWIGAYDLDGQNLWLNTHTSKELLVTSRFYYLAEGNNFWLGTINGLFKIHLQETPFRKAFYKKPKEHAQVDFQSCRAIVSDTEGTAYVATYSGCYNIATETSLMEERKGSSKPLSLYLGMLIDRKGMLWTSAFGQIIKVDRSTGQQQIYTYPELTEHRLEVWSFYQDRNDRLWMGTNRGLLYLDENSDKIRRFHLDARFEKLSSTLLYALYEDRAGKVWLATIEGLYELDIDKETVDRYWTNGDSMHFLSSNNIRHLFQDDAGIFWIASQDGLIRWDKVNNQQELFTMDDGLSHNSIYSVYEDRFGFLWMSSDNGIMQFEKTSQKIRTYFPEDGITHREFNYISHHQAEDGTLYFGGLNGVTYFHPQHFVNSFDEQLDIPLVLTECHLFSDKDNRQVDKMEDYHQNQQIILGPNDRYLSLQFALLDYNAPERVQYVYNIDGEEGKTIKENALHISGLSYGKHLLTIKGRTGKGLFSKQVLSIPLIVLKPFYWQWWFLVLCLLGMLTLAFIYQQMKTRSLKKRQEELEQTVVERTQTIQLQAEELRLLDKSKSRFLANISHEFRTPLTLILNTLKEDTAKNGKVSFNEMEVEIMQRNAQRLRQLIEQLLDVSKLEAGKMSLQVALANFEYYVKELVRSFEPLAQQKQVMLSFFTNVVDDLLYFDRDKMDKIMYNLLSNAIKFTPEGGVIEVRLKQNEKEMWIDVEDTGIGISEKESVHIFDRFYQAHQVETDHYEGTGLGLSLVKEFTELHGGRVEVNSQLGKGSCFSVYFPLGKKHYNIEEVKILGSKDIPQNILTTNQQQRLTYDLLPKETSPTLLIVEDNEDLLSHHRKLFGETYNLLLARDGKQGLTMAFKYLPDLIVCDVMMPIKNGYEVCRQLKLDERTNHIPVILLTAKASHEEKMEGLMVGADDYLIKPYDQAELSLRVQNLLELQRRLQTQWASNATPSSPSNTLPNVRNAFIEKCMTIIEEQLTDRDFGVEKLSQIVGMSRTQLFRKIKSITGTTPTHFIRSYRLKKARQLLLQNTGNASEVSYMVGFNNPNYFFKCFKEEFGMTVSEFLNDPLNNSKSKIPST